MRRSSISGSGRRAATAPRSSESPEAKLGKKLEERVSASDRAVLIWSGRAGGGGARLAELGHRLGLDAKPGCAAFHLPSTPNARGVADAWAACSDEDEENPEPIGLLIVSGDEAAADPAVRALAEQAERVIAITMFQGLAVGWADLVLPGTSYLERDGSFVNLEGRVQRLRRAVIPPVPDELAWIAKLAERFDVEVSPHAALVFEELSERCFGGIPFGAVGERAPLPDRTPYVAPEPAPAAPHPAGRGRAAGALPRHAAPPALPAALLRPGRRARARAPVPAAEAEIELAYDDAQRRQIATGDEVSVRSNGTSLALRARVSRALAAGTARIADEHAGELHRDVEVVKAP